MRAAWLDVAKGIGIILVVLGHAIRGLTDQGFDVGPAWEALNFTIYTFHMPLFFLLAGVTAVRSLQSGVGPFLRSRMWTVVYPYILWSIIQICVKFIFSDSVNTPVGLDRIQTILWEPHAQFWFLYVLFICNVLFCIFGRIVSFCISIILFPLSFLLGDAAIGLTAFFFPIYALGALYSARIFAFSAQRRYAAAVPALPLAAGAALAFNWHFMSPAALPATIAGVVSVLWISKRLRSCGSGILADLGQASMSIYVMHVIVGAGARTLALKMGIPSDPAVYILIISTAGVLVPWLAHTSLGALGALTFLGLAPFGKRPLARGTSIQKDVDQP